MASIAKELRQQAEREDALASLRLFGSPKIDNDVVLLAAFKLSSEKQKIVSILLADLIKATEDGRKSLAARLEREAKTL